MAQIPGADPEAVPLWQQIAAAIGIFGGAFLAAARSYIKSLNGEKPKSAESNQVVLESAQLADLKALSLPLTALLGETQIMRQEVTKMREIMEEREEAQTFDDRFALALQRLDRAERAQNGESNRSFPSREDEENFHRARRERKRTPRPQGRREGA